MKMVKLEAGMEVYYIESEEIKWCIFQNKTSRKRNEIKFINSKGKLGTKWLPKKTIFFNNKEEAEIFLKNRNKKDKIQKEKVECRFVECVNQGGIKNLTNGKIYRVLSEDDIRYRITDGLRTNWYSKKRFKPIKGIKSLKFRIKNIINLISIWV